MVEKSKKAKDKMYFKSVLISLPTHTKLKVQAAKKGINISKFVDDAILEKIKNDK